MTVLINPKDEQETPDSFFRGVNSLFDLELDVCASDENAKCPDYFTIEDDALKQRWDGRCWMNPPYSNPEPWLKYAYFQSRRLQTVVVALVSVDCSTAWWHKYVMRAAEIYFVNSRLKFNGVKGSPRFSNAVAVFSGRQLIRPYVGIMNKRGCIVGPSNI